MFSSLSSQVTSWMAKKGEEEPKSEIPPASEETVPASDENQGDEAKKEPRYLLICEIVFFLFTCYDIIVYDDDAHCGEVCIGCHIDWFCFCL